MFTIPGILLLIGVIYIRPQEFIPALRTVPLLYICVALAGVGLVVDLRLRRIQPWAAPQLLWALLFFVWCLVTLVFRERSELPSAFVLVGTALVLFLLIAHGVQTFRMLQLLLGELLAIVVFLSFLGVHQGLSPFGCQRADASLGSSVVTFDGRPCTTVSECERGDAEPGVEYECERTGLLETSSIGRGRVRYRGPLNDPNELALAIGIGLPFAFAFVERKRSIGRIVALLVTLAVVGTCTVFTSSRGGQLVYLAVLGVYFVRRFGVKGLVLGALLSVPILLYGGRSGEEAESSSLERLDCWFEGISMVKEHPLLGVGQAQFSEHHTQTAHNSYLLAAAELGLPGMLLFSILLYISIKIPVQALRKIAPAASGHPSTAPPPYGVASFGPDVARTWAMALLASQVGLLVGIMFLSFCYHPVLWIYWGLTGALYMAIKRHDETFEVRFTPLDLLAVIGIDLGLLFALFAYTRLMLAR